MQTEHVSKDDVIHCKSWWDLSEINYEKDCVDETIIPPAGLVYCNIEWITQFFKKCEMTDNKYVVVSAYSDYGIAYQEDYPVSNDIIKWFPHLIPEIRELGYRSMSIGPRCYAEFCDIRHKYSVKVESFTKETFDKIPDNIEKWFLVNCMVPDQQELIQGIPLGVAENTGQFMSDIKHVPVEEKDNLLYINWQNTTAERAELQKFYKIKNDQMPWVTYVDKPKPFEEYLEDLSKHLFVMCPQGNGPDCHRIYEAIYAGCIPIVKNSPAMRYLQDLPILMVDDWQQVSMTNLKNAYETIQTLELNYDKVKLSYWKNEIDKAVDLIK